MAVGGFVFKSLGTTRCANSTVGRGFVSEQFIVALILGAAG
jgi:hypothetical protein